MIQTTLKTWRNLAAIATIVVFALATLLSFAPLVSAHTSPGGCTSSDFVLNINKSHNVAYDETNPLGATEITYTVQTGNPDSGTTCDVTDVTVILTTPDGIDHSLEIGGNYPAGTAVANLGSVNYTVSSTDIIGGDVTASAEATGKLHDSDVDSTLSVFKSLSIPVIHPDTAVTITASADTVYAGDTVDLTITEENTGDTSLGNVSVDVTGGVGTLTKASGSFAGGDTDGNDRLDADETWTWNVNGFVVNSDTTFTAVGHGTDALQNDITVGNSFLEEEDSIDVNVIDPSTITTIDVDDNVVEVGDTVTLTVTETNDGDGDLTNVSVDVSGVGTLDKDSANFSGDDGDGVLEFGETWQWLVDVAVGSDTTFTATGHGTDALENDVTWCEDVEQPGDGVLCDQDEQDSVDVQTVLGLVVNKTADTSYDLEWDWTITKTEDQDNPFVLEEGQAPETVNYTVEVSALSAPVDQVVSGTITIANPEGNPTATGVNLTDSLDESGNVTDITCVDGDDAPVVLPADLDGGETITCDYTIEVDDQDDALNTVTVTTTGDVPGDTATADVLWGDPVEQIDECITVSDTNLQGPQGVEVCADDEDKTFEYAVTFGNHEEADVFLECGLTEYENIASYVVVNDENDTGENGEASATVTATVECVIGCTLTQGYWKTHNDSFWGGAPSDDNWMTALPPLGEKELFLDTEMTWFDIFWTAPKGNAWYNLAHQYMAAWLNTQNGASAPQEVEDALVEAEELLTQASLDALATKGKNANKELKAHFIELAGILGEYNEGLTGPGHCTDQEDEE